MYAQAQALLAEICQRPDDDLPRLIYADLLEECGEPLYARFIRDQITGAHLPPWHAHNVKLAWHCPFSRNPAAFRRHLPPLSGKDVDWLPFPWRRGLPAAIHLYTLASWEEVERYLRDRVPLEEIHLGTVCTYDQLQRWVRSPLLGGLKCLHISGNPIEPLRVLRSAEAVPRLEKLHLLRCTGAGFAVALEEFLHSPAGRSLQELHLRLGHPTHARYLLEALAAAPPLRALTLHDMGLQPGHLAELLQLPLMRTVQSLDLSGNPLGLGSLSLLVSTRLLPALQALRLKRIDLHDGGPPAGTLTCDDANPNDPPLALLDLSHNFAVDLDLAPVFCHPRVVRLHSLQLRDSCSQTVPFPLPRLPCYPHLVELDLRGNQEPALLQFLEGLDRCEIPSTLAAVAVSSASVSGACQQLLATVFGPALVLI